MLCVRLMHINLDQADCGPRLRRTSRHMWGQAMTSLQQVDARAFFFARANFKLPGCAYVRVFWSGLLPPRPQNIPTPGARRNVSGREWVAVISRSGQVCFRLFELRSC